MFFSFSLDCLKMHPWRDRCLGKVQIYVHWSGFTWYNFRLMKSGWSRLCLHQHFSCRQQCGFAVNPVSMQYWCWGLSTKTALFWSAPLSRGYLDIFSNADTAQLLAGHIKPLLWTAERNKRQIICFIWDRRLRTRWMKNTIKQLRCTQWTLVSWVKRVNPCPTCAILHTLSNRWGTSPRSWGAQKELWGSPMWQEGTRPSGEHVLSISSWDPMYNSDTSLGQDLLNWMQLGTRKLFPVSSIVKDLPVSDVSCQLDTGKPQRRDCTIVSKFVTAFYFWHKKGKPLKKQTFYWIKDMSNVSAPTEPIS